MTVSSCGLVMQSGIRDPAQRKVVVGKEPPNQLIAQDQTRCIVTERQFEEVAIGETVSCVWFEVV